MNDLNTLLSRHINEQLIIYILPACLIMIDVDIYEFARHTMRLEHTNWGITWA